MLFFGHIGITAGVIKACDLLQSRIKPDDGHQPGLESEVGTVFDRVRLYLHRWLGRIKSRTSSVDYRIVLLGSMLPDIIDKPLWFFIDGDTSLSGRDYSHTLLFSLVLLVGGMVLLKHRRAWLLILSLSSFMHLIFDEMWNNPVTLLWPLLGPLLAEKTVGWFSNIIQALFSQPGAYVPEIIGLVIVLLFAYRLLVKKRVVTFIRRGVVE